ncbi:MAG: bifunctional phosphoribosylaminoimidazolecarboxamide formyltransferase/IMP cyclohydrolase, partial [Myxococcales bacterium]|nr:bifunctional phosphoribosylaminoimidazolecarboxamide formyltransferase/IMP cyclohydrolase [Myxococcales bacterium]
TNLRLLKLDITRAVSLPKTQFRSSNLGVLVQQVDPIISLESEPEWRTVTTVEPTAKQMAALGFLWRVCKHIKSNAIVIGGETRTYGIGAGQMSRVDAVELALKKLTAPDDAELLLASDAFFPFRDNVDVAHEAGISAIIQPGGSKRDQEVIDAANEAGIAMVFTGRRHFKH